MPQPTLPAEGRPADETTDVVIIGSGFAGLAAAIEAVEAGAGVVILEKNKTIGGNSSISDGALAAAGTPQQRAKGIDDSPELMAEDMIRAGLGLNHRDLVMTVCRQSADTVRWTIDHLGVEYLDHLDRFGGHSAHRAFTPLGTSGSAIVRKQAAKLKELGVAVRTRSKLTGLIADPSGRVTGVEYEDPAAPGSTKTLAGRRGVVLATGGFGADVAFRTAQDPRLDDSIRHTNQRGATAEGLSLALRLGAAPVHLSWIQLGPWGCADEKGYGRGASFASYALFPYGLVVDPQTGQRFFNELADRRVRAEALLATGRVCVGLLDAQGAAHGERFMKTCLKRGYVRQFDTLDDLAGAYAIPAPALKDTVAEFNRGFDSGRGDGQGKPLLDDARPLTEPPWHAIRLSPKVHYCMGGLRINPRAQVIDLEGHIIPGLLAAGEVTGGVHGASRLGSCAIIDCLVMGRIAGKTAAGGVGRGGRVVP